MLSWAQGGPGQAKSNTYCRPSLGLGNTDRAEILEGAGDCDQKSVAGTLPATDFWRGTLHPKTRARPIAGRRSHGHRNPSGRIHPTPTVGPESLGLGNCDQKSAAGALLASRNTGVANSRPTLSWAQGGPAQAKFPILLRGLSGARKYSWSRHPGLRRLMSSESGVREIRSPAIAARNPLLGRSQRRISGEESCVQKHGRAT